MRIKAVCNLHPNHDVILLAGTTNFIKNNVPQYCAEEDEKAIAVELDEENLYCTAGDGEHDTGFKVLD